MARDLDELVNCQRCDLAATRQRVVIGSGPERVGLMVIGEAPGRSEDEGGEPFIGRSGRLLFSLVESEVGLAREDCFVTNVVKCRPPDNRTPRAFEIEACRAWLDEQMAAVAPRVVLVLGNTAARAVLGAREGVGATHGRVVKLPGAFGLATYHPAAALRSPRLVDVMRADLRVVKELVTR